MISRALLAASVLTLFVAPAFAETAAIFVVHRDHRIPGTISRLANCRELEATNFDKLPSSVRPQLESELATCRKNILEVSGWPTQVQVDGLLDAPHAGIFATPKPKVTMPKTPADCDALSVATCTRYNLERLGWTLDDPACRFACGSYIFRALP
jgi:hypothetical protein